MADNYLEMLSRVTRNPRHTTVDDPRLTVQIIRQAELPGVEGEIELTDLSRGGCAVACGTQLLRGEIAAVRLTCVETGFDATLTGHIRWTARKDAGQYSFGLQFDEEIEMEVLGELFLLGVLAAE